jgi:cytochrome c oxidase subunit I
VKSLERLTLAHLWVAFAAFVVACFFGVWQMWARSPLSAPFVTPDHYFLSVTAHGVAMAFVLTTFFVMGFGYFTAETALERPLPGKIFAWLGFALALTGVILASAAILGGRASVLYTFYPPLTASPIFYVGLVLIVVGSWVWCVLNDRCNGAMEARQPGYSGSTRNVRDRRQCCDVAVDNHWSSR